MNIQSHHKPEDLKNKQQMMKEVTEVQSEAKKQGINQNIENILGFFISNLDKNATINLGLLVKQILKSVQISCV